MRTCNLFLGVEKSGLSFSACCYCDPHHEKQKENEYMTCGQNGGDSISQKGESLAIRHADYTFRKKGFFNGFILGDLRESV